VVCLSVCRLSHLCTLLDAFNGFRCNLVGTLVGSNDIMLMLDRVPDRQGKERFGGRTCRPKRAVASCCCHLVNANEKWFCVLPNYFDACSCCFNKSQTQTVLLQYRLCVCRKQPQDGKPVVRPEFKNAKVASLYDIWQRVLQLSAERRQRLQQTLDRLNEVSFV